MDFERICMIFSMQEPYYGILLSSMDRVPDPKVGTIGVARFGNVFKLHYNPDFINKFNTDTVLELLKHECLHLALGHFISLKDKENGDEQRHKHINAALDLEANCYIDRSKVDPAAGGLFCADFGFRTQLGSREYFDLLAQKAQQQQQQQAQAQNPQQPCNGGLGGNSQSQSQTQSQSQNRLQSGSTGQQNSQNQNSQSSSSQGSQSQSNPQGSSPGSQAGSSVMDVSNGVEELVNSKGQVFDDHSMWPDCETEQEVEALQQVIDDMVEFAAEEVEKKQGFIPGELVGKIRKIRERKPRPVCDWKRHFRRFCGNEFTEDIKKSRKRESKRFPDAAGNRHRRKSHILVAIDTSGSVSMPEYDEFMKQIRTLSEKATFHVVECDTIIQHEYDFTGRQNTSLHGGGRTSFEPPIEMFLKDRRKYDALVYFTDGYADIPENTPKETLWVISSKGDHNRAKYKVNGATSVFIR